MSTSLSVFSCPCVALQPLASFPTRRSSDLVPGWPGGIFVGGANVPRHLCQIRAAVGDDPRHAAQGATRAWLTLETDPPTRLDRKSTRLNSSHVAISYAVFCLKKKKKQHELN